MLGVSDDSLETHARFSRKYDITFPLISDRDGTVKSLYGRTRITYLIDREGVVRLVQKDVPVNSDFLNKLKELEQRN